MASLFHDIWLIARGSSLVAHGSWPWLSKDKDITLVEMTVQPLQPEKTKTEIAKGNDEVESHIPFPVSHLPSFHISSSIPRKQVPYCEKSDWPRVETGLDLQSNPIQCNSTPMQFNPNAIQSRSRSNPGPVLVQSTPVHSSPGPRPIHALAGTLPYLDRIPIPTP